MAVLKTCRALIFIVQTQLLHKTELCLWPMWNEDADYEYLGCLPSLPTAGDFWTWTKFTKNVHAVSRDIFPSLLRLSVHALDFNLALIRRITLPLTKEQRDNFSNWPMLKWTISYELENDHRHWTMEPLYTCLFQNILSNEILAFLIYKHFELLLERVETIFFNQWIIRIFLYH